MTSLSYGVGRYVFGFFVPEIQELYGFSGRDVGRISSATNFAYIVATAVAAVVAMRSRPWNLIAAAGSVTAVGLLLVALSESAAWVVGGIVIAGSAGGLFSPALYEVIEHFLPNVWKVRALAATSAGTGGGLALTGMTALLFADQWRVVWLVLAAAALSVTVLNVIAVPRTRPTNTERHRQPLRAYMEAVSPSTSRLYAVVFIYGVMLSIFLTFAIDFLNETTHNPPSEAFWTLIGLAGIGSLVSHKQISRLGWTTVLRVSLVLCGLAILLLLVARSSVVGISISAILFGYGSQVAWVAVLAWMMSQFRQHPSLGSGSVFVTLSIALIIAPLMAGMVVDEGQFPALLLGLACIVPMAGLLAPQK